MILLILISLIFVLIYLWFQKKFSLWSEKNIVHVPAKFPFGSFNDFGKKHTTIILREFYQKYKGKTPLLGMYFFTKPVIMPTEPEIIKDILTRNFESFHDRGLYFNEKDDPLTGHLFGLSGKRWKDLRVQLTPTFTSGKTKMMFETVLKEAEKMVDYMIKNKLNNENYEMKEILASCTTQVIASVAFGLEIECMGNSDNRFRQIAYEMFNPSKTDLFKQMFMNSFPKAATALKLSIVRKDTTKFFIDTIKATIDHREANNVKRNDFLQLLIQLKNEQGMTLEQMAAQAFIFFLAGFETSSSVAMFMIYELALNPDIQERLRNEIEEISSNYDDKLTYEGLSEMKYFEQVFKETLRKYPVVDIQLRSSTKDYEIPNTSLVVPANTMVFVSTAALHYDERFYENPDKFDPERFSSENEKKIPSYAYIPFSEGPRICIGQRFGTMQTKIVVANLLKKFEILPCEKTLIPMKFDPLSAFQSPVGGMWLKLKEL
jgi:cytochrome P450 family 6